MIKGERGNIIEKKKENSNKFKPGDLVVFWMKKYYFGMVLKVEENNFSVMFLNQTVPEEHRTFGEHCKGGRVYNLAKYEDYELMT